MTRMCFAALALVVATPAWALSCGIDSVTAVSFGAYDVFATSPLDSTGTLWVTCTGVLPADNITIDLSKGGASSFAPRQLTRTGGGSPSSYNLYLDAARVNRWGDGTAGTGHYGPANPEEGTFGLTVYGRIPARQDVVAGSFSDAIVATINF